MSSILDEMVKAAAIHYMKGQVAILNQLRDTFVSDMPDITSKAAVLACVDIFLEIVKDHLAEEESRNGS